MSYVKLKSEYKDLSKYSYYENIFYCKKDTYIKHNPYGPAIIYKDGAKFYFIDGNRHRLDGPAAIWPNGCKYYYINNEYLTKKEFKVHPERLKFLGKEYLICLK